MAVHHRRYRGIVSAEVCGSIFSAETMPWYISTETRRQRYTPPEIHARNIPRYISGNISGDAAISPTRRRKYIAASSPQRCVAAYTAAYIFSS